MKITDVDRKNETVKIKNDSDSSVDISSWKLLDSEKFKHQFPKYRHRFIFPAHTFVGAGKTLNIHTFSGKNTKTDLYQNRRAPIWNNLNDVAILLDENSNLVSRFPQQSSRIIGGYIYKAGTKNGIAGADVTATLTANPNAPGKSVKTDNFGYYILDNLVPAKYKVTAAKKDFVSESENVDVAKADATQDFYLEASSSEIEIVVDEIKIIPAQPEWNKTHKIKVIFKNKSDDVYHFETKLYRRKLSADDWSEVPGTSQSFDEVIEKNETKEVTFTAPVKEWMDWDWFSKDSLGFVKETEISRKIFYKVWFKAVRQEDEPAFESKKEFEVVVKVDKDKRDALKKYNKYLTDFWVGTGIAVTATAAAGPGFILGIIPGIVASAVAALATAMAITAKNNADAQEKIMKDP